MKVAIVQSSQLGNRWDAKFHILATDHEKLFNELMERMDLVELRKLALDLPFDESAANAVLPRLNRVTESAFRDWIGEADFRRQKFLDEIKQAQEEDWRRSSIASLEKAYEEWELKQSQTRRVVRDKREIAVYCAAALQSATARIKEQLLELSKQKLAVVTKYHSIHKVLKDKGVSSAQDVMNRNPEE
jgi:hypothetical protein